MFKGDFLCSQFVLLFRGDDPIAYLCNGFDATMIRLQAELGIEPDEFAELFGDFRDEDSWQTNDLGPFACRTEYGDGGTVEIIRIHKE